MKLFILSLWAILITLNISCCRNSKKEISIIDDNIYIKTANLINVNIFEREKQLYVVRYSSGDSCKYIQLLCKKNNEGNIYFKNKSNWISLDSVSYYSDQLSNERIKAEIQYSVDILVKYNLIEITSACDKKGIRFLTKDSLTIFFTLDDIQNEEFANDTNYVRINKNWWILKSP